MKTYDFLNDYQEKLIASKEKQAQINKKIERYRSFRYLFWAISLLGGMLTGLLFTRQEAVYLLGPLLMILSLVFHGQMYKLIARQNEEFFSEKRNQLSIEFGAIDRLCKEIVEDGMIYLPRLKLYRDDYPELLGGYVDPILRKLTSDWVKY